MKRKLIIGLIVIALCLMVFLGLIVFRPQISNYLTTQSLNFLSRTLNLQISAKEIKGNIFTSIVFSDVKIKFSSGDSLTAQSVKSEYNLFSILFKHRNLIRNLLIVKPNVYLVSHLKTVDTRVTPFTLPIIFLNKLEIQNGAVFQNSKIVLDSFSMLSYLRLHPKTASALVNKANFYLPAIPLRIQNFNGNIHFHNNTLSLQNIRINTPSSMIQFNAFADFLNRYLSFDIQAGHYDLKEIINLPGLFDINGQISLYFEKDNWNLLNIRSNLNYRALNLKLPYVKIADGKGKIEFIDTVANITCITPDSFYLNALCTFNFPNRKEVNRPISYQGKLLFNNFNISIKSSNNKLLQNNLGLIPQLDGFIEFNGIGFEQIEFNLLSSSKKPAIESISAKGAIKKGKLEIEKLRIKDRTSILNSTLYQVQTKPNNLMTKTQYWFLEFKDFSLYLVSEVLHQIVGSNLYFKGFVNGSCHLELSDKRIKADGELNVRKGLFLLRKDYLSEIDFKFEKLKLKFNLPDLQNLPEEINLCVESIFGIENQMSQFNFILNNKDFLLTARNWINNRFAPIESLTISGTIQNAHQFSLNILNIDNLIEHLQITTQGYFFTNTKEFRFGKKGSSFYLQGLTLKIGSGNISLDLTTYPNQKPQINFRAQQIDLKDIGNIIGKKPPTQGTINLQFMSIAFSDSDGFNQIPNNSGYYIVLSGKDLKIPISLFAKQENFKLKTLNSKFHNNISVIELKYLKGTATFDDFGFQLKQLTFVYAQDTSTITGKINFASNNSSDYGIDLNIVFRDPGAWIFFFLKTVLNVQYAKIYGQGKITGTFNHPVLSGEVKVFDARLLINSTQTLCHKVNAKLIFHNQKVFLDNLKGYTSNGIIQAHGFTELFNFTRLETLSCQIEFQDIPIRPHKDIMGIASGKVFIDYKPMANQSSNPLSLSGAVVIKEGLLTNEFAEPTSISSSQQLDINLNLTISAERGIWLRNRLCDIELSANLNIFSQTSINVIIPTQLTQPTRSVIVYSGQLRAIQGIFYYLDHPLKITKGVINFDNISELNPSLDINAEVLTRPIEISSGLKERVKIILSLTGRFKEPIFTLSSDPAVLTENDIISYLNFNVTWQEMTSQEFKDAFSTALSEKLFGYFERELTKRIRNLTLLDYLSIESGLLSKTGAKITVGKYIGSRLYFTYEYNISGTSNDIFRLEYYIAKSHQIIGERDVNNRYNLKYQYKIRY
ncbi:MAG: translocation/assembly module TamB [candidate division WOR-3 bacterium]|nr:translocation/assembly module TamB [candidate division WOR-3 bacterium]